MKIAVAHELVMPWWVMFGEIIGHVEFPFSPDDLEMCLCHAVVEPVETHVEGFGELRTDRRIEDTGGC